MTPDASRLAGPPAAAPGGVTGRGLAEGIP